MSKILALLEGSEQIFPGKRSLGAPGMNFVTRISKLATLSAAAELFFRRDTVDIVGRFFYVNEWKFKNLFWVHRFFC